MPENPRCYGMKTNRFVLLLSYFCIYEGPWIKYPNIKYQRREAEIVFPKGSNLLTFRHSLPILFRIFFVVVARKRINFIPGKACFLSFVTMPSRHSYLIVFREISFSSKLWWRWWWIGMLFITENLNKVFQLDMKQGKFAPSHQFHLYNLNENINRNIGLHVSIHSSS